MIAFRRKAQRININKLVFVDQTNINEAARPIYGLSPKGKKAPVSSRSAPRYSPRIDVMSACVGDQVLDIDILTPEQRRRDGVKGYTKKYVLTWLREKLAPCIHALRREGMVVVFDKGLSMTPSEAKGVLVEGGCPEDIQVWIMETGIAKHCSPLDNALWHEWKERVRGQQPISELSLLRIIPRQWYSIPAKHIKGYYRKCALIWRSDVTRELD